MMMMDVDGMDRFISGLLKLDMKHLSAEKRRELSIQIRSFNLERHSSHQKIHQMVEDLCQKVNWHFQMLDSYDQLYSNHTIQQLDAQLVSDTKIKIPRARAIQQQVRSVPHLQMQAVKARIRSAKKLQSTLTSVSTSDLPLFGNISTITHKPHITVHYKGNRRSSLKTIAIGKALRRSSAINFSADPIRPDEGDDDQLADDLDYEADNQAADSKSIGRGTRLRSTRLDATCSSHASVELMMQKATQRLHKSQTVDSIVRQCHDVRNLIERQFDLWIEQMDPLIANRLISDFPDIRFVA